MWYIWKKWTGTTLLPVRSPFGSLIFRWLSSPVYSSEGVRSTREQWQEKRVINQRKAPPARAGDQKSLLQCGGPPTPLAVLSAVGFLQPRWPAAEKDLAKESCPE